EANLVQRSNAGGPEGIRKVIALSGKSSAPLEPPEERPMKRVTTFFRNQVDSDASGSRVRGASAGLVHHLLAPSVVQIALDGAVALVLVWRSTTGDSPVTVTVSSSTPTLRSPFTDIVKLDGSSRPSRLTVAKPVNENVTV